MLKEAALVSKFTKKKQFYLLLSIAPISLGLLYVVSFYKNFEFVNPNEIQFVSFVLVHPLLEEIFFRGIVFELIIKFIPLRGKIGRITYSNILISLLFCLAHLYSSSIFWSCMVFLPSLIFGLAREEFETVTAPLFIHSFYNFCFYVFLITF